MPTPSEHPVAAHRRRLNASEISTLAPYIPRLDLESAVLHVGYVPWYLPARFAAIARGTRIYVRAGVYRPQSAEWLALLGHELVHVRQYREGMTAWRYLWSAARGYAGSRYEREAYAIQARIAADLRVHSESLTGKT